MSEYLFPFPWKILRASANVKIIHTFYLYVPFIGLSILDKIISYECLKNILHVYM